MKNDRRFDQFNSDVLARRCLDVYYTGAKLDLDDPRLKDGEPRPLEKTHWQY